MTSPLLDSKTKRLHELLRRHSRLAVAFSGGVDSTFLLCAAVRALGKKDVVAFTVISAVSPGCETAAAARLARSLGVRRVSVRGSQFAHPAFVRNHPSRCYVCKKHIFSLLKQRAAPLRVVEGSTLSDRAEFRPGRRALKELGIQSPLEKAGFTKDDVRRVSRQWGLPTWRAESAACLASRVAYGIPLTTQLMRRIERAESFLRELGFRQVRLRHYGALCRIEVARRDIPGVVRQSGKIVKMLKKIGYANVTVDLEGFRSGSMNDAGRHP